MTKMNFTLEESLENVCFIQYQIYFANLQDLSQLSSPVQIYFKETL